MYPVYFLNIRLKFRILSKPHRSDTSVIETSSFDFKISTAFSTRTLFKYCENVIPVSEWNRREKYAGFIPIKSAADVKSK